MVDQAVKKVLVGSLIGAVASCTAITVGGILAIADEQRSLWFWPRLVWVNVLAVIAWIALTVFFAQISRGVRRIKGFGGVSPTITYFLLFYVISGYIGMFMSSFIMEDVAWEVAIQIYNTAGLIFSSILLYFSWLGAMADTSSPKVGIAPPSLLAHQFSQVESLLEKRQNMAHATELKRLLKQLREFIQYSLPDIGPFALSDTYARFAQEAQALIDDLGAAARGDGYFEAEICAARAQDLLSSAAHCAGSLKD